MLLHLSKNLWPKTTFQCTVLGKFLAVSDIIPASAHPITLHRNRVQLVHINIYKGKVYPMSTLQMCA